MTPYIQAEIEIHQNIKTLGSSYQLWKSRAQKYVTDITLRRIVHIVYFLIKEPQHRNLHPK
jgi:hypothetical protein